MKRVGAAVEGGVAVVVAVEVSCLAVIEAATRPYHCRALLIRPVREITGKQGPFAVAAAIAVLFENQLKI